MSNGPVANESTADEPSQGVPAVMKRLRVRGGAVELLAESFAGGVQLLRAEPREFTAALQALIASCRDAIGAQLGEPARRAYNLAILAALSSAGLAEDVAAAELLAGIPLLQTPAEPAGKKQP